MKHTRKSVPMDESIVLERRVNYSFGVLSHIVLTMDIVFFDSVPKGFAMAVIHYTNSKKLSIPVNLVFMISSCCSSTVIKYVDAYQADIILPVILNYKESGLSSQSKVVPILPNTGVAFVVKRADRKHLPIKILSSIFSSWPVLVLTLLLSVLAGIVAWILVCKCFIVVLVDFTLHS